MSSLSRLAGALTIGVGLFVGVFAVSRALAKVPPPLPLTLTLVGVAVLNIILGIGVMRRARAAWSFALALGGVGTIALLLAIPELLRSGISPVAALGAVCLGGVLLALLIVGRKEIP